MFIHPMMLNLLEVSIQHMNNVEFVVVILEVLTYILYDASNSKCIKVINLIL